MPPPGKRNYAKTLQSTGSFLTPSRRPAEVSRSTASLNYTFELWGINDGGGAEFFDEDTLTFALADPHTSTDHDGSFDTTSGVTLIGSLNPSSFGNITFSSADSSGTNMLSFLNADTNNRATFILFSTFETDTSAASFASKEPGADGPGPTLTVIPEPSSLALMVGGLMLAVGLLRRRK